MSLIQLGVFSLAAVLYLSLVPLHLRSWTLMGASIIATFWLQPALPIRRLDFILPTATIALTILMWAVSKSTPWQRKDQLTLIVVLTLITGISLTRYLIPELRPTPSRPPGISLVLLGIAGFSLMLLLFNALAKTWQKALLAAQFLILTFFVLLKSPPLATQAAEWLREAAGQSVDLAEPSDLGWLGFSYIAFRLLHVLREAGGNRLPEVSLREHITYTIFFPALTAGPIDRIEHYIKDDRALVQMHAWDTNRLTIGLGRITIGIFKKFVVADTLALIALNNTNAQQALSTGDLWILLYAYSFRLYLDFSGYSDIAIGLGQLFGIQLPENFRLPYLKTNITDFWQNWHITLSDWVRFYVFSPLSRHLLRRKPRPHPRLIVFSTQMATMITIGLWHGITSNFFIWGLWHGLGLFIHKTWTDHTRKHYLQLDNTPRLKRAWQFGGWLLTFHFVTLGWVWFTLSDFGVAGETFLNLLGVN